MPNLRGRDVPNDHRRGREVPKDSEIESNNEFDFGSAEESKGGSAEESKSGHKGSSRKKEPKPTKHGGDEAIKGEKTEDELETTNSDESENRLEEVESVWMIDLDALNQPRAKRKRSQEKKCQHRDNKEAENGRVSRHAHRKGRSA